MVGLTGKLLPVAHQPRASLGPARPHGHAIRPSPPPQARKRSQGESGWGLWHKSLRTHTLALLISNKGRYSAYTQYCVHRVCRENVRTTRRAALPLPLPSPTLGSTYEGPRRQVHRVLGVPLSIHPLSLRNLSLSLCKLLRRAAPAGTTGPRCTSLYPPALSAPSLSISM